MNLVVNSSPHIHGGETTRKLMLRVVLALLPALAAGVIFFGPRVLTLTLTAMAACLVFEWLYRVVTRQSCTLPDGSALVTGLLFVLTLPVSVPYWVVIVGAAFAMIVV